MIPLRGIVTAKILDRIELVGLQRNLIYPES